MRILIAGEFNQTHSNVNTKIYVNLTSQLKKMGHIVDMFSLQSEESGKKQKSERKIDAFYPDYIHVATEGTFFKEFRQICREKKLDYTTSCLFSDPCRKNTDIFLIKRKKNYSCKGSYRVLTARKKIEDLLNSDGIKTGRWVPGVDTVKYSWRSGNIFARQKPSMLYFYNETDDRENVRKFLDLKVKGTRIIVGTGSYLDSLKSIYTDVFFAGERNKLDVVDYYSSSDLLVVTDKKLSDGSVILESLSCGTPVVTVDGNIASELIKDRFAGSVNDNLEAAIGEALNIKRDACREFALEYSLEKSATVFLSHQTIADF